MTFTGYCSNEDLVKFLDYGSWTEYVIDKYENTNTYILPQAIANGLSGNLIAGMISATDDDVTIPTANYSVDTTTGLVTFTTHPADGSIVKFKYYLCREYTNSDISYYVLLGARKLELDTHKLFREVSVTYATDANEGYDYINLKDDNVTLELPYNIKSVTSMSIDGTAITVSTLKVINNKICLTKDSEVTKFSGKANSIAVIVKHGQADTSLSEEENRLLDLAKEANKRISAIMIIDSPLGRNVTLDNSYIVQKSDGSVRPDITVDSIIKRYEDSYNMLKELLMNSSTTLI